MNKNLTPLKQEQNVFRETNQKTAAGTMHDRIGQKEQRHKHQLNADADRDKKEEGEDVKKKKEMRAILIITMAMIIAMATGCGYSKQCTTSPLQEYNRYKE